MTTGFLHGIEVIEIDGGTRPIQTVRSSVIGVIGTAPDASDKFPLDTPVLITGSPSQAKGLGLKGTLPKAMDGIFDQGGAMIVVVRVAEVKEAAAQLSKIVGDAATNKGVHAFLVAESIAKVTPRILIAPGFTSSRPDNKANPVVAELQGIAERLRAVIIADGPNTTKEAAIAYREDWGSDRIYVVDPWVSVWDRVLNKLMPQPSSPRVAGRIAITDNDKGFWWSPSNQILNGISGTSRPIDFGLSDANCTANLLNENEVVTIVHKNGYRLWGNRTCATDPQWAFLSVRRTADMIYESMERAFLWAMDRPMSANLVLDIQGSVDAYLRDLTARGAILGGKCWFDAELNTKEALMAGKLTLDFDIEPPAPLEHLVFRARRNNGYYETLAAQVQAAA